MPAASPVASDEDPIEPDRLRQITGIACFERLAEAASTMDLARLIANDRSRPLPALIVADRQTHGRGRRGAGWWQSPGSLAASVVYSAADLGGGVSLPCWSLACGVAVAEGIRSLEPAIDARVRWPNDVEVAGRKIAGILVETAGAARLIFGIGVNTSGSSADAPLGVRHRVVTFPDLVGRPLPRAALIETVLSRLGPLCREIAARPRTLVERFAPLCALTGQPTRLHIGHATIDGMCQGIAEDGSLLLETPDGPRRFASGTLSPPGTEWRGEPDPPAYKSP